MVCGCLLQLLESQEMGVKDPPPNNLQCHCVKLYSSSKLCMGVLQQQARPSGKDPERHAYLSS